MAESPSRLRAQQHALTRHLRDPASVEAPAGMDPRRTGVYRRLLFNNVSGLLANGFPVSVALLGESRWNGLMKQFYGTHECQTPLFTGLAAEFVEWLRNLPDPPHPALAELAHYEWVETALYQMDAEPLRPLASGELRDLHLQLSPLAWPLLYHWPVHRLGPAHAPCERPDHPTTLLARRDRDGEVRFSELGILAAQLLHDVAQAPGLPAGTYLHRLAQRNGRAEGAFDDAGMELLARFHALSVIGQPPSLPTSIQPGESR